MQLSNRHPHGTCFGTFLLRLPELLALSDVSSLDSDAPWEKLVHSAGTCSRFYRYKFVEFGFDAMAFFTRHPEVAPQELPRGELVVRLCAPAVSRVSDHAGALENPRCSTDAVGRELVPFVAAVSLSMLGPALVNGMPAAPYGKEVRPLTVPKGEVAGSAFADTVAEAYYWHHMSVLADYQHRWAASCEATKPSKLSQARQMQQKQLVGICISGLARSLSQPEVYLSIRDNVSASLGTDVDVRHFHVWQPEAGRLSADFAAVFAALPPAESCTSCLGPMAPPVPINLS